jgi:hypothetical protein
MPRKEQVAILFSTVYSINGFKNECVNMCFSNFRSLIENGFLKIFHEII